MPWLQEGCQDFCILYFSSNSCPTCFGQPCAHHQENTKKVVFLIHTSVPEVVKWSASPRSGRFTPGASIVHVTLASETKHKFQSGRPKSLQNHTELKTGVRRGKGILYTHFPPAPHPPPVVLVLEPRSNLKYSNQQWNVLKYFLSLLPNTA